MSIPISNPLCYEIMSSLKRQGMDPEEGIYITQALRQIGIRSIREFESMSTIQSIVMRRKLNCYLMN